MIMGHPFKGEGLIPVRSGRGQGHTEGFSSYQVGAWARRKPLPCGFLLPWWAERGLDRVCWSRGEAA